MSGRKVDDGPRAGEIIVASAGVGFAIGALLAAWATIVRLFGGSDAFQELNTSYPLVVVTYLGIGLMGGALAGCFGRFVHGRFSAAVLGFFIAIPCGLAFLTAMGNGPPWSLDDLGVTLLFSATLGATVGFQFWRIFTGEI